MLELILWVVAFIVITEICFILISKINIKARKINQSSWGVLKVLSILFSALFLVIQYTIVNYGTEELFTSNDLHYDRLIWEFVILGGLFIFFYLNKLLYNYLIQKEGSIELKGGKKKK